MTLTSSTTIKNFLLSFCAGQNTTGFNAINSLRIYTSGGSSSGTLLLNFTPLTIGLPSSGSCTVTAANATASATGTAAVMELWNTVGTPALMWSGTVTVTGGGGDLTIGSTSITSGAVYSSGNITFSGF